jgi:flagellar protein FlaF
VEVVQMGFSVSGSAAIIFAALFIAFGMYHSAATDSFERVSDARDSHADAALERTNTEIAIESAVRDLDAGVTEFRVRVNNTGSTALSVEETDALVDSDYRTGWRTDATVDGTSNTELWLPGEQLVFNLTGDTGDRVKVVTEHGVADSAEVTGT